MSIKNGFETLVRKAASMFGMGMPVQSSVPPLPRPDADLRELIEFSRRNDPTEQFKAQWGDQFRERVRDLWGDSKVAIKEHRATGYGADQILMCMAYDVTVSPYLGTPEAVTLSYLRSMLCDLSEQLAKPKSNKIHSVGRSSSSNMPTKHAETNLPDCPPPAATPQTVKRGRSPGEDRIYSLGVLRKPGEEPSPEKIDLLKQLEEWRLDHLFVTLSQDPLFRDEDELKRAAYTYKQLAYLRGGIHLDRIWRGFRTEQVDVVWRQHVLHVEDDAEFCDLARRAKAGDDPLMVHSVKTL